MPNNRSRRKGNAFEKNVKKILDAATGLDFEFTPGSGSGKIKGDLYLEHKVNVYCIECKHYKSIDFNEKMFTQKSNTFVKWWTKLVEQAAGMNLNPLLIFKQNHGQIFVATHKVPVNCDYMYISWLDCYVTFLNKWLEYKELVFDNGDIVYQPWETDSERQPLNS